MTTERIRVPKRSRSYERSHSDAGVSGMESPPNEGQFSSLPIQIFIQNI